MICCMPWRAVKKKKVLRAELEASNMGCEGFEDAEILGIFIVLQLNV